MKFARLSLPLIVLIMMFTQFPGFCYPPSSIVGLSIESILFPEDDERTGINNCVKAGALLSLREKIGESGYISLLSEAEGGVFLIESRPVIDEENINLEAGFDFTGSRLILDTFFASSFTGRDDVLPYYKPMWETRYYFSTENKKPNPFLSYKGFYFTEPSGTDDRQFHGGTIGFEWRPSLYWGFGISGGGGWEEWFEYPLVDETGIATGALRNDYIVNASLTAEGFIGFYVDWSAVLHSEMRWSTANLYDDVHGALIEKSEEKFTIGIDGSVGFSPTRHFNIEIMPEVDQEIYFYRPAQDEDNEYTGERIMNTYCRGIVHLDWTPNNEFYFVCEMKAESVFSTHYEYNDWNIGVEAGIEYSFPLSGGNTD
ncbi:MAG: hypothetical protein JW881_19850 [Spirochaetales bacterium]|nr:hypothetical protein [Spirochaetales bacterium]